VRTFPVPFDASRRELAKQLVIPQAVADRTLNTVAVAVACALLHYDPAWLAKALTKAFPERTKVSGMNSHALELAHAFASTCRRVTLASGCSRWKRASGAYSSNSSQSVTLGKLEPSMTFQT
jgi:hypothetical protein